MYRRLNSFAEHLARALALAGGGVLIAVILLTCVSIAGRAFLPLDIGLGPIRGIYDMTEIGMAAAIFTFLPWMRVSICFNGPYRQGWTDRLTLCSTSP